MTCRFLDLFGAPISHTSFESWFVGCTRLQNLIMTNYFIVVDDEEDDGGGTGNFKLPLET